MARYHGIPKVLSEFAPAKVNLFLHVTGKREDGYHLLDSLAVFPAVGDTVSFTPDDALSLAVTGTFGASLGVEPDNLVLRAARMLAGKLGRPATGRLKLEKNLPVASGIGGGSADAAATLRLVSRIWDNEGSLTDLALALGADVPVCISSVPARMGGVGEILSPPPRLPRFGILLVNPGVPVATADVFRSRKGPFSSPADLPDSWPDAVSMAASLARLGNDLEAPAVALTPAIGMVLAALRVLPEALLARMSGSGATCFALFASPSAAVSAAAALQQPNWWRWGGGLYEAGVADL